MKLFRSIICTTLCCCVLSQSVFAEVGDMGFFSGISSGRKLPKTTETLNDIVDEDYAYLDYKEMFFITGQPEIFEGKIEIEKDFEEVEPTTYSTETISGIGSVSYIVEPYENASEDDMLLERDIDFDVNYYTVGQSTVKDYSVNSWEETIIIGDEFYVLDSSKSIYELSIVEDKKPAVNYYTGDLTSIAYYMLDDEEVKVTQVGRIYGYTSGFSHTETHRIDVTVERGDEVYEYQIRPSVMAEKDLIWNTNEPSLISYSGNYREILNNVAGFNYTITNKPTSDYLLDDQGTDSIITPSTFEQLIPTEIPSLKGHWAYSDIQKLFALRVLTGVPELFKPNEAITRSDYVEMIVNSIKLEVEVPKKAKNTVTFLFPDVTSERNDYNVIMTAYKNGLIVGQENTAQFYPDEPVTREEAITIIMRSIGLENLGIEPSTVTPFVDNNKISEYAKNSIYVAHKIGLITPDSNGNFNPKEKLSKAQAAALCNRLMEYMREDLYNDFSESIVNYLQ
ncbi:MAG: S-layer homology domain-containing protein [Lachnospirales bacterium]